MMQNALLLVCSAILMEDVKTTLELTLWAMDALHMMPILQDVVILTLLISFLPNNAVLVEVVITRQVPQQVFKLILLHQLQISHVLELSPVEKLAIQWSLLELPSNGGLLQK